MISQDIIISLSISIAICFLVSIGSFVYFTIKDKRVPKSFIVGSLVFFISQILIRIPILTYVLPNMMWFIKISNNPYLYGIFLGLTAGIFEEVGRFIAFKYILKKNYQWIDGIYYGFGHGGIEALLITGVSCLNLLVGCIMINNGTFDALISSSSTVTGQVLYNQCINLTSTSALLGGIERIFAMIIQIGLSLIVLYGVRNRKIIYLFVAILIHTLVNGPIVILPQLFNVGTIGLEIYIFICALVLGVFILYSKKLYKKETDFKFDNKKGR